MTRSPLALVLALAAALCGGCVCRPPAPAAPVDPGVPWDPPPAPPPVVPPGPTEPPPPPPPPPPAEPPGEPTPPPPVVGDLPAVGTPKSAVEAAWGSGTDLPENPGERDVVAYLRTVDGRRAQVHVVYQDGLVLRVVVSFLVGGG